MGMSNTVRAGISLLVGILSLYILENTFGTAFDEMYQIFTKQLATLHLGAGWSGIGTSVLGGWVWFDRAFVICIIALFIWFTSFIFIDVDYSKQR
jgi:hypothetical protein